MPDSVRIAQYYKMLIPHKPGEGLKVLGTLQKSKVNLLALLAFPQKKGKAQVDLVPSDSKTFNAVAKRSKWKIHGPKTCFLVEGSDRIGGFASHAEKLAKAKINVHATTALCGGAKRFGVILWVKPKHVKKAAKVLGAK